MHNEQMEDLTVSSINEGQLVREPWKHWTVNNVLPDHIIDQVHKDNHFDTWPEIDEEQSLFITTAFEGDKTKSQYTGYRYYFKKDTATAAAIDLTKIFTHSSVVESLTNLTGANLKNTFLKVCYSRERNGWSLHKHDDHPETCKLTMIVYLPIEGPPKDNEMGTSLYNQDLSLHHREKYSYNLGSMFVPCTKRFRRTLHGFDGEIEGDRRFVLFQYLTHEGIDMDDPRVPYKYDGVLRPPNTFKAKTTSSFYSGQVDTIETLWRVNA